MLLEMESEVAMKQWTTVLAPEAQETYSLKTSALPCLWEVIEGIIELHHCSLTPLVPKLNQQKAHQVVWLVGRGAMHANNHILPRGHDGPSLQKNDTSLRWEPISDLNCEQRKGIWLCPQKYWVLEIITTWPKAKTMYGIWEGDGFLGKELENQTVHLPDHYCGQAELT